MVKAQTKRLLGFKEWGKVEIIPDLDIAFGECEPMQKGNKGYAWGVRVQKEIIGGDKKGSWVWVERVDYPDEPAYVPSITQLRRKAAETQIPFVEKIHKKLRDLAKA